MRPGHELALEMVFEMPQHVGTLLLDVGEVEAKIARPTGWRYSLPLLLLPNRRPAMHRFFRDCRAPMGEVDFALDPSNQETDHASVLPSFRPSGINFA